MKPPKLKQLTKKELRREYTRQWREAIRANGEIVQGNYENTKLHQRLNGQQMDIECMEQQTRERIAEKEKMLEALKKISNWNVTGFEHIKEGELILIMQSYFDEKMKEKEELEREKRLMTEAKNNITNWDTVDLWGGLQYTLVEREKYREIVDKANRGILMEGENTRMKEEIEDWKEAVSRSRNLMNSYKEFAERMNTENNSIEKMARIAHKLDDGEPLAWISIPEEKKDMYRVIATRIVSEDPDKE